MLRHRVCRRWLIVGRAWTKFEANSKNGHPFPMLQIRPIHHQHINMDTLTQTHTNTMSLYGDKIRRSQVCARVELCSLVFERQEIWGARVLLRANLKVAYRITKRVFVIVSCKLQWLLLWQRPIEIGATSPRAHASFIVVARAPWSSSSQRSHSHTIRATARECVAKSR